MRQPPPKSTLFPYTTLFRSLQDDPGDPEESKDVDEAGEGHPHRHGAAAHPGGDDLPEQGALRHRGRAEEHEERSEEHTSELQSHSDLVCRLLLEKKKKKKSPLSSCLLALRQWSSVVSNITTTHRAQRHHHNTTTSDSSNRTPTCRATAQTPRRST